MGLRESVLFLARGFRRPLFVLAVLLLPSVAVEGGQQQLPVPTWKAGVEIASIDVTVLGRDGSPVTSLETGDFAVTVDGKPRRVVSLTLLTSGGGPRSTAPTGASGPPGPALSPGRLFVLAVDRQHIPAGGATAMLDAAVQFIDGLDPADRVAVWTIPPTSTALQLSTDREPAKRALRAATGTYRPPIGDGRFTIGRDEALAADEGRQGAFEAIVRRECSASARTDRRISSDVGTGSRPSSPWWLPTGGVGRR